MADRRTFVSHAQNGEDVVLWRALGHLATGRYVEVGANDPTETSITRAFYDRGWRGLEVEPVPSFAERFARERPRDVVVRAAVTDADVETVDLHLIEGTGLSTLDDAISDAHAAHGWEPSTVQVPAARLQDLVDRHGFGEGDVHFCVVDVEGAEAAVLRSVDLRRWRPWVLVVEATEPLTSGATHGAWEPAVLEAGYEFCLFDGLSRYYVAAEHAPVLREALSRPANPLDDYVRADLLQARELIAAQEALLADVQRERDLLTDELVHWRARVLQGWADTLAGEAASTSASTGTNSEIARLKDELEAMRQTLSWRVTAPLRVVRARQLGTGAR